MAGADADEALGAERSDPEPTDLAALRVTREESRAVLDHQIALLNEIDERTVRTVQLAGVTLGIVVSVLGLAGPSLLSRADLAALLLISIGICSLLACVLVGVGTYSVSKASFGVDGSFRREVVAGSYDEREWLRDLLAAYDEWSGRMRRMNRRNGGYLLAAQLLLLGGVTCLVAAIVLTVIAVYL